MDGRAVPTPQIPVTLVFVDRQRSLEHFVELDVGTTVRPMLRGEYEVWITPARAPCEDATVCVPAKLADRFVVGEAPAEFSADFRPFTTTLLINGPRAEGGDELIDLSCADGRPSFELRLTARSPARIPLRVLPGACRVRWTQPRAWDGLGAAWGRNVATYEWPSPVQWRAGQSVSLDVPMARMRATVEIPSTPTQPAGGVLRFESESQKSEFAVPSRADDVRQFEAMIPHGVYRVFWESGAITPATRYELRSRWVVDRDVTLTENIAPVLVQLTRVSLRAGSPVSLLQPPQVQLRSLDDPAMAPVPFAFDNVVFRARVRPGNYAIDAIASARFRPQTLTRVDIAGTLRDRIEARDTVSLAITDLAPVNVEIDALLDGALLDRSRVKLRFVQASGGATFEFDADRDAAAWLMPGRYHVESMGTDEVDSLWPPGGTRLASDVEITGPTRIPIEIRSRRVRGVVTLDGAPLPVERCSSAPALWVRSLVSVRSWPVPLAADGRFDVRVPLQGTALLLAPSSVMCPDVPGSPLVLPSLYLRACSADP